MDDTIYKLLLDLREELKELHFEYRKIHSELQSMCTEENSALEELAESQRKQYVVMKQYMEDRDEKLRSLNENKLDRDALRRIG